MLLKKRCREITIGIGLSFFLGGCAAVTGHQQSLNTFDKELLSNKCEYTSIQEKIDDEDDTLLWGIQGGSLARNCNNYKKSNEYFDLAESKYKDNVDKDSALDNVGESASSVLVNNNINDYEGNVYEKIMVNTYKALNFTALKDYSNARIEFNRALDRQRRAKDFFDKEIKEKNKKNSEFIAKKKEEQSKAQKNQKVANKNEVKKDFENNAGQKIIYKNFANVLDNFETYPDFINPFTTYMSGIYFLLVDDSKKARELLKESLKMDPTNKQIQSDFQLSEKYVAIGKNKPNENYAWIIYENGQGMSKKETRIDIPLFLFTGAMQYTGIAFPKIEERNDSYKYLNVNGAKTQEVCNMDNVIKTEFKKRFPLVVTEAILNTVVKSTAQYALNEHGGLIAGIAGSIYQAMTNKADVRSWTALPKSFHSVRIKLTGEPIVIKNDKDEVLKTLKLPENKNAIIYVKSPVIGNDKIHEIIF